MPTRRCPPHFANSFDRDSLSIFLVDFTKQGRTVIFYIFLIHYL